MAKLMSIILVALLATTLIMAAHDKRQATACGRHGDECTSNSNCCESLKCNRFARRCQVQITPQELMEQRDKIFNKRKNQQTV